MVIKETLRFDDPERRIVKDAFRWANFCDCWKKKLQLDDTSDDRPRELKVQSRLLDNDWLVYQDLADALEYWKLVRSAMEGQIKLYRQIARGEASMFAKPEDNKMSFREGDTVIAVAPLVMDEKRLAQDMVDNWEYGLEQVKRLCNMLYVAAQSVRPHRQSDELEDEGSDDWMELPEDTFIVRR